MKLFFAKYLPVEGEIKEGDEGWMMVEGKLYRIELCDVNAKNVNWYGGKKVKLFLCSRDIQVGDKIRAEYGATQSQDYICAGEYDKDTWTADHSEDDEEFYFAKDKSFKVMGEISPEATWVKEGMEFDEDEVAWLWEPGEDMETEYITPLSRKSNYPKNVQKYMNTIAAKCPHCGGFDSSR